MLHGNQAAEIGSSLTVESNDMKRFDGWISFIMHHPKPAAVSQGSLRARESIVNALTACFKEAWVHLKRSCLMKRSVMHHNELFSQRFVSKYCTESNSIYDYFVQNLAFTIGFATPLWSGLRYINCVIPCFYAHLIKSLLVPFEQYIYQAIKQCRLISSSSQPFPIPCR